MVLLLRLIAGWWAVARLTRRASPVAFCCDAPVRESPLVATPVTAGVLAPTIILPTGLDRMACGEVTRVHRARAGAHPAARSARGVHRACESLCLLVPSARRGGSNARWLHRPRMPPTKRPWMPWAIGGVYAGVLLDIADAVRRRGARVAWQGIGAEGTGRLGRRIDRVLQGDAGREIIARAQGGGVRDVRGGDSGCRRVPSAADGVRSAARSDDRGRVGEAERNGGVLRAREEPDRRRGRRAESVARRARQPISRR